MGRIDPEWDVTGNHPTQMQMLAEASAKLMTAILGMKRIWASGGSVLLPPEPPPDWDGEDPPGLALLHAAYDACDIVRARARGELAKAVHDLRATNQRLRSGATEEDLKAVAERIMAAMQTGRER